MEQLLIQWEGKTPEDDTWETLSNLEDKVSFEGGRNITPRGVQTLSSNPELNYDKTIVLWTGNKAWESTKLKPLEPLIRRTSGQLRTPQWLKIIAKK